MLGAVIRPSTARFDPFLLKPNGKKKDIISSLYRILSGALALNRFPAFCGALIGCSTILQYPFGFLLERLADAVRKKGWVLPLLDRIRITRFLAAIIGGWLSLRLLNGRRAAQPKETRVVAYSTTNTKDVEVPGEMQHKTIPLVGKTMDITLFAVIRALDVLIGELWTLHKSYRFSNGKWTRLESLIGSLTDTGVFVFSASIVMWAWFYVPDRLPRGYSKWISEAAQVDPRLIEALRQVRYGNFVYGKDTGQAPLLQSMCREYNWPEIWGDPAKTIPIPCDMVHMGTGPNCEWHATVRFARAFRFALATYLPLNLAMRLRSPSSQAFKQALKDAVRSSAFLGAFICLFYYSVCLSRTRLGPKVFRRETVTPTMWDEGLCVGAGCAMCGWSILFEAEKRRQEIAFFIAPRAAATILPRRYEKKHQWRETLAFSISTAVVLTCVQENPNRVRGVLGRLLHQVID
ncbi:MAG: hypothetical protein M1827_005023 [Pycnora praestabilis]|nr:MAG: hypothetical protein M1827_005023 [Pycnora praestabilis]